MPAYEFYIEDCGQAALEFRVVIVRDEARARQLAEEILAESPQYVGLEVRLASRKLFALGSLDLDAMSARAASA